MGILYFFSFLYQFSMLFNGNFAFLQFSMLFNGNMRLRSFGKGGDRRTYGRTDRRTYRHLEIHPCVLQDIGPLGPLPKKGLFLLKYLEELFIRKCQTFIFQILFSEFDYLYHFWSYVVIKCCKRDELYCRFTFSLLIKMRFCFFAFNAQVF